MTTIRYFIPEDGDDELHPNVFLAPKPRQPGTPPTLQSIRDAFPLPGQYHFRFKSPLFPGGDRDKGAMPVWMDVTKDVQPVPTWRNGIVAKVTRLSMEEDDDDDDDDFGHRHHHTAHVHTPASAPAPPPPPQPPSRGPPSHASSNVSAGSSGDHLDIFDGTAAASSANHTPVTAPASSSSPNLFDSHPPSAPTSGGSLLDFGATTHAPAPSAVHSDFLGMTAPHSAQQQQQQHHQQQQYPQQQQWNPQQQQQQQQQQQPQGQTFNSYAKQAQPFGDLGGW